MQNQVLKITTREKADETLETRVYNVRDFGSEFGEVLLANVIRKSVQPRSWMNVTIQRVEAMPGMEGGMMPGMPPGYSGLGSQQDEIAGMTIHADSDGNGTIDTLPGCLIITSRSGFTARSSACWTSYGSTRQVSRRPCRRILIRGGAVV